MKLEPYIYSIEPTHAQTNESAWEAGENWAKAWLECSAAFCKLSKVRLRTLLAGPPVGVLVASGDSETRSRHLSSVMRWE